MGRRAFFYNCPRCGEKSYEKLHTYSHCVNCLFVHDRYEAIKPQPQY